MKTFEKITVKKIERTCKLCPKPAEEGSNYCKKHRDIY